MNFISLGYFCSIALDLEKLGLRASSSPFDWVVSDFEGVILSIQERLTDFCEYKYLSQNREKRHIYKNTKYNIDFHHDFSKYRSLSEQLPNVSQKYRRRIDRFFKTITEPTLFIRYISDEETVDGKSKELCYIESNLKSILELIKSFNRDNDILFMANNGVCSDLITIYNVEKDENDTVARSPIFKNPELFEMFNNLETPDKQINIDRYLKKNKVRITSKIKRKLIKIFNKVFAKEYVHENQY